MESYFENISFDKEVIESMHAAKQEFEMLW